MTIRALMSKALGAITIAGFVAAAVLIPSAATAVDFSGKKITVIVPFKEGGSATVVARLFAPFYKKYLPGNPDIIVQNMPGGGSIRGNNWFHTKAKPDGTYFVAIGSSSQTNFAFFGDGASVKYDMLQWKYILALPQGTVLYARPETGVKGRNIKDDVMALRKIEVVVGAKQPKSSEMRKFLPLELLGITNVKAVFGLASGPQRKAMLRGEINFNEDPTASFVKKTAKYVEKGTFVPLMTLGYSDENGNIVRDPAFPKIPTIVDAYKAVNNGKMPSGILWKTYKHVYSMSVMTSKGHALPPKTPQKIVDTYVEAVRKIIKDKKFKKDVGKQIGIYPILIGAAAQKAYADSVDVSPEAKAYIHKFVKDKFGSSS